MLGAQIEKMDDNELAEAVIKYNVFVRLVPVHKQRIIQALQQKGHVTGFMRDGTNDAPALKVADVGISMNSAVDITKESSDIILLPEFFVGNTISQRNTGEKSKLFITRIENIRTIISPHKFSEVF